MVIHTPAGAGARRALMVMLIAIAPVLVQACRTERPDQHPGADTSAAQPPAPLPPPADTTPTAAPVDTAATGGAVTGRAPGVAPSEAPGQSQGWKRSELVQGVQAFITAIDSNDQAKFWGSLSHRSMGWIEKGELGSKREIWSAARETLGDIRNRRITVIGGSPDSVALRVDGLRMIDGARQSDPIIIDLLREGSEWKVMYPGLLYPQHHLIR